MKPVTVREARARLSQLVDKVAAGEDVLIARHGKPLVRITQIKATKGTIRFGLLKGQIRIAADFDAPLPQASPAQLEGR